MTRSPRISLGPVLAGWSAMAFSASPAVAGPVRVEVDMDSSRPGIQHTVRVPPGTTLVPGVGVYVYDPQGGRSVLSVGYLGGLDRGLSLGHTPAPGAQGHVVAFDALTAVAPINPAGTGFVFPAMDRGFAGPEVQYIEWNAATPALIQTSPAAPIFTVDVRLASTADGDTFNLYLLDFVSVWQSGQNGAFTTSAGTFLDTGGDAVPDGTPTLYGLDPDVPIPVPPAAFEVDFIDGPGRIVVVACYPDCSADGQLTVADFGCFQSRFVLSDPYADCTCDGALTVADFGCFQTLFVSGCP